MKAKATFVFEFEPNTSYLSPELLKCPDINEYMAENAFEYILDNDDIEADDFDFEIIDDHNEPKS